jgi:uncharacterized membrane protein
MRSLLSLVVLVAACGTDVPIDPGPPGVDKCASSPLDYNTFGEPFIANWCRGCHSSQLPAAMRQKAPVNVNFDTVDQIRTWSPKIMAKAGANPPTMPPAGGPSDAERATLVEWIDCGAK